MAKTNILVLIKTSSEDEDERRLQDVFIKTNVCWESDIDELDIGKLQTTLIALSKVSNVVKSDVVKKTLCDELV